MTTNLSFDQIKDKLEKADKSNPNIRISYTIQSCGEFRDVIVRNDNKQLIKATFHKPAAEPYVLP